MDTTMGRNGTGIGTVEQALEALANGEMVVVADHENRENEGDLILAAEHATPSALSFMVRHTSGLICVGMSGDRLDELDIPLMVRGGGGDSMGTAFTVSVDYAPATGTGISAADRAATIRALVDPAAQPGEFLRPGHVFPLRAKPGGVLQRPGHTEAAVDLARLAGRAPAGVLCELVNDDGTMMRGAELVDFARRHGLIMITVDQLIAYRRRTECLVRATGSATVHTDFGRATVSAYESTLDSEPGVEHAAVVYGDVTGPEPVLVRVHSECLTGDVLASSRCDCGPQLRLAHARIAAEGRGVIIYLRGHEGRGIGLGPKLQAYALQDQGLDTLDANLALGFPADARDYVAAAQILQDLGVDAVRLLTNNPAKARGLADHDISVVEQIAVCTPPTPHSQRYLDAKRTRMGHLLPVSTGLALVS